MVDYPIKFNSNSEAKNLEKKWNLETNEGLKTTMSPPKEFGGSRTNPSPESLFSASLETCILATFQAIADRKNLNYKKIESEAEVSLDRGEDTRPIMKKAEIILRIKGVRNQEKAREVADAAENNCFIHNSVKTDVETRFEFKE